MVSRGQNFQGDAPLLYLVSTPIGNLSEWSPRAIEVVGEMDYVAAEDTRNSAKLLAHFGIKKPMISCHEHNEEEASAKIVSLLLSGKKVCYMSDAGYPGVSDPGERLAKNCLKAGIHVSTLSGPSAALNALVASGLSTARFHFIGFLPAKDGERDGTLSSLKNEEDTLIFYEAPHRIGKTLKAMASILGPREAVIARELTKQHEEYIRGNLQEFSELDPDTLLGEMVIIVSGAEKEKNASISPEEAKAYLQKAIAEGMLPKDAIKKTALWSGLPKNEIYDLYLSLKS